MVYPSQYGALERRGPEGREGFEIRAHKSRRRWNLQWYFVSVAFFLAALVLFSSSPFRTVARDLRGIRKTFRTPFSSELDEVTGVPSDTANYLARYHGYHSYHHYRHHYYHHPQHHHHRHHHPHPHLHPHPHTHPHHAHPHHAHHSDGHNSNNHPHNNQHEPAHGPSTGGGMNEHDADTHGRGRHGTQQPHPHDRDDAATDGGTDKDGANTPNVGDKRKTRDDDDDGPETPPHKRPRAGGGTNEHDANPHRRGRHGTQQPHPHDRDDATTHGGNDEDSANTPNAGDKRKTRDDADEGPEEAPHKRPRSGPRSEPGTTSDEHDRNDQGHTPTPPSAPHDGHGPPEAPHNQHGRNGPWWWPWSQQPATYHHHDYHHAHHHHHHHHYYHSGGDTHGAQLTCEQSTARIGQARCDETEIAHSLRGCATCKTKHVHCRLASFVRNCVDIPTACSVLGYLSCERRFKNDDAFVASMRSCLSWACSSHGASW